MPIDLRNNNQPPIKREDSIDYILNILLLHDGTYNFYLLEGKKFKDMETRLGIIKELEGANVIVRVGTNLQIYSRASGFYNFIFNRYIIKVLQFLDENDSLTKLYRVSEIFASLGLVDPGNEFSKGIEDYLYNNEDVVFMTEEDRAMKILAGGRKLLSESKFSFGKQNNITNQYNYTNSFNSPTISNSTNASIVLGSQNVNVTISNKGEIRNKINELRDAIEGNTEIDSQKKQDLLDCLDEVETNVESGKKPKFAFKALMEQGANIAGVASLALELGKLIFGVVTGIPLP